MSEKKIIVNSINELISKAKEFAVSQGGTGKTGIIHSYVNSGEYTLTKNGPVKKNKGGVGIKLKGKNGRKAEYFLEDEREERTQNKNKILSVHPELLNKVISELGKINISYTNHNRQSWQFEKQSFSALAIPCSNLQELKDRIKEYYQKNQVEIRKNPDFNQWVKVTHSSFGHETKYSKEGEETSQGHFYEATFSLKEYEEKSTNIKTDLMLRVARNENDFNFSLDDQGKELENYWNSLRGNQTSENPEKSPVNSPSETKNKSEQIRKIRQEIKQLEDSTQTDNNPEKQKELEDKKKKLSELKIQVMPILLTPIMILEIYLGLGTMVILAGGIMARWLYLRKKVKNKL